MHEPVPKESIQSYRNWLEYLVSGEPYAITSSSHTKLLDKLFRTEYRYTLDIDRFRCSEGVYLRTKYVVMTKGLFGTDDIVYYDAPCSLLEMMVDVSMELEQYMERAKILPRISMWFWKMIESMGLLQFDDAHYDEDMIDEIVGRFCNNQYSPNGQGGLFTINRTEYDVSKMDIHTQMILFINIYGQYFS